MNTQIQLPDFSLLKSKVMNWLKSMRISENGFEYKFSYNTGSSLFTTCFALYILDLFRETENLSSKEKQGWANYINSFQRKEDGLFYPKPIFHPDRERAVFQATSFCLSALKILDTNPRYRLSVVDNWRTKNSVEEYLTERGCDLGFNGSGNKAMFQAIFLTHEYERTNHPDLLNSIYTWFDFHNRHQNRFGFWGNGPRGQLYKGFQNAFHQFVIYEYWNQDFPRLDTIVQTLIEIQDEDGFFSPLPGGDSCKDYDSIHFLIAAEKVNMEIEKSLKNAHRAITSRWNSDGGFCENSLRPYRVINYPRLINFMIKGENNRITISRAKEVVRELIKPRKYNTRAWVKSLQPWGESTLWDTWFRCLSIAEISHIINNKDFKMYKFPEHIGIGHNKYQTNIVLPVKLN